MPMYYPEPSRTFSEYLLLPNLTRKDCVLKNVSLRTPITRFEKGSQSDLCLNIPISSAIMQSVSGPELAIALARCGGISFIYGSQPISDQAEMVSRVKNFKAGFVLSDSNIKTGDKLSTIIALKKKTGHSTMAVTSDGTPNGILLGIVTGRDYKVVDTNLDEKVDSFMTPFERLIVGREGISLSEANDLIWEHKLNCLPIVSKDNRLLYFVFRKDYDQHMEYPDELSDEKKRLIVGAGINTKDYAERIPELIKAGADILCIDSSDGYSEWQEDVIKWVKETYKGKVKIGAGNVVDREGFDYLVAAGADFIKVGIGPGSICITREQKGIGRGQATAVAEVAEARDRHLERTGTYIPICADGGIVFDYHITLALAMGADFVMMGRYFARFDESPTKKAMIGNSYVKEYWGEGSNKARNWQRYDLGGSSKLDFEEGIESYVPYAGPLRDTMDVTISKIKSTMCNCGVTSLQELRQKARLVLVSSASIREGGAHDVFPKEHQTVTGESF
jgi:IMP dehydrogenase